MILLNSLASPDQLIGFVISWKYCFCASLSRAIRLESTRPFQNLSPAKLAQYKTPFHSIVPLLTVTWYSTLPLQSIQNTEIEFLV